MSRLPRDAGDGIFFERMGFVDFFLVTCRVLHVFSAVAWIGGLAFLGGVAGPVFKHFGAAGTDMSTHIERRFVGFVWTTAWGLGVSGVLLTLLSDQFLWFDLHSAWRVLLVVKQVLFVALVGSSLMISSTLRDLDSARAAAAASEDLSPADILRWRITMLYRVNLLCGIGAIIVAAMMR